MSHAAGLPPFANEPVAELRRAGPRRALLDALRDLEPRLPVRVPVLVGDDVRHGGDLVSVDPGRPERVVATAARASESDVDAAVALAREGQPGWARVPAAERAAVLLRAAAWLREHRAEVTALEVRECAKPWAEADGDVCEAIDFLEYYARGAIALEAGCPLVQVPGERNDLHYVARGVVGVVAPWNFPVAIPMGMVSAGLATGNAVVLKPAEQSPGCGLVVVQALREAGVPSDVLALMPGDAEAGRALVRHPRVHTIAFTGSAPVGLEILREAGATPEGQRHLKRVVAEMGGKNCVLVDADADLDDAVPAIAYSAFGYAGQKCSAASRVLVHEAIADALIERLGGAVDVLQVGQADAFGTDVPPVIEAEAQTRVERYARLAAADGRIVARAGGDLPGDGFFCAPTVAADLSPESAVLVDEIFGPVLAIERVRDMAHALDRVDELRFALTGGLFCRNPRTVEQVAARMPVGNLYVNRGTTGAMVGRQPFGGNRVSGTGTKAGGPDYLLSFVEPRVVSENTMRHGLVVE